jgi:oligopeptide/dipeptide ABC transporter ATP-binding protein
MNPRGALLEIDDLHLDFDTLDGRVQVLDGVSLSIAPQETVGIVGETGCGKSITAKSVLRLLPSPPARFRRGSIRFKGRDLLQLPEEEMRNVRGLEIAMIFQDPMTYLNPVFTIGQQVSDVIAAHERQPGQRRTGRRARRARAVELLRQVRLPHPEGQIGAYPHQLSGGMRQRVLIAMALAGRPAMLIADEPTTALDVTIQAQILRLIAELVATLGLTVMMISHDLGVVAKVCRRIVVMYAGTVVEDAPAHLIFTRALHPYTQGLLKAIPQLHGVQGPLEGIPGSIPNLLRPPAGCRFFDRCPVRLERCREEKPPRVEAEPEHRVACHLHPAPGSVGAHA